MSTNDTNNTTPSTKAPSHHVYQVRDRDGAEGDLDPGRGGLGPEGRQVGSTSSWTRSRSTAG